MAKRALIPKNRLKAALRRNDEGKQVVRLASDDNYAIHASEYLMNYLSKMFKQELGITVTDFNYHIDEPEKLQAWYEQQVEYDRTERKRLSKSR